MLFENRLSIACQNDSHVPSLSQTNANTDRVNIKLQIHRSMRVCVFRRTDLLNWIPVLVESFCLIGLQPGEVRLIVGIGAGHQLDIRPVFVRQISIPCITEFGVSPRPEFLARSHPVIRSVNHSRLPRVVISAAKIVLRLRNHI